MRLTKFIQWWWKKNDEFSRTLACCLVFFVIPAAILAIFIGKNAILYAVGGIVATVVGWALYGIFYWLRSLYHQFDDEEPSEEVLIVRRLKGIPTPSIAQVYDDD